MLHVFYTNRVKLVARSSIIIENVFFSKDPLPAFIELKKGAIYNLFWRLKTGRQHFRSGLHESPSPPLDLRVTGYIKG
jgi:hypothetical protein